MALISTEQLKNIVKTYLDENDIDMTSAEYAALDKVSAVTGLMNKIAATFTIEGDYTEELKEFSKYVPGLKIDTVE